jgi:Protein of unknown function DUF262
MNTDPLRQSLKLEADTETVEDLVGLVRRGLVRIPSFQRELRWRSDDVLSLFDSVYRGYPIGSFLLQKGEAPGAQIRIGPLTIDGPETHDALWVVDGQQRLTALTVGLSRLRPIPITPDDAWVAYFDVERQEFTAPPKVGGVPSTWVPVAEMLDASVLSEWVFNWKHRDNAAFRATLFQAGTRIRQYQIPVYIVETKDEQLLRDIFYRINKFGQRLEWDEVHDALFGRREAHPSTLGELADELQKLGMGRPEKEQLLSCLTAYKGLDVTRNLSEHYRRDSKIFTDAVQEALPAIRGVLSLFRRHAEIAHLRLLPRSIPLVVLTRFFALYPEPKARTLDLLTRWTWRTLLSTSFFDERTLLRHGVDAIREDDEEESVQRLLSLVPRERQTPYSLPSRFDARAADTRLALLGLASLQPRDLNRVPIDVAALIEMSDVAAFRRILPTDERLGSSPANRVLLPGSGSARKELVQFAFWESMKGILGEGEEEDSAALRSHGLTPVAMTALESRDTEVFIQERSAVIEKAVNDLGDRLAAWSRSDRPSISYLLQQVEAEG